MSHFTPINAKKQDGDKDSNLSFAAIILCPDKGLSLPLTPDWCPWIYPFDGQYPQYSNGIDPFRRAVSVKYGLYTLAGVGPGELQNRFNAANTLIKEKEDDVFLYVKMLNSIVAFLSDVEKKVKSTCESNSLRIMPIVLTIPRQWNVKFEAVCRQVVAQVFHHEPLNVFFVTDAAALANVILREHLVDIRKLGDHRSVLFLDFGAHSMNGSIFQIVYEGDQKYHFYQFEFITGAGGGSNLWSYLVGERCAKLYQEKTGEPLSNEKLHAILSNFNKHKHMLGPGYINSSLIVDQRHRIVLSPKELSRYYNMAHQGVWQMVMTALLTLKKYQKRMNPVVVASGGTARHSAAREQLRSSCNKVGLPPPVFAESEFDIANNSGKLARGAALAEGDRITVRRFLERGAAFGLLESLAPGSDGIASWETEAKLLFTSTSQKAAVFNATGMNEHAIVCDPYYPLRTEGSRPDLRMDNSSFLCRIEKLPKGQWSLTMSIAEYDGRTCLTIDVKRWWNQSQPPTTFRYGPVQIYYDAGTNCVRIDPTVVLRCHIIAVADDEEEDEFADELFLPAERLASVGGRHASPAPETADQLVRKSPVAIPTVAGGGLGSSQADNAPTPEERSKKHVTANHEPEAAAKPVQSGANLLKSSSEVLDEHKTRTRTPLPSSRRRSKRPRTEPKSYAVDPLAGYEGLLEKK
ncbi:hypothetical protein CTRI78_v002696 [Colletotrichum trifolii]|uniref:Heat shock 70 kDa protein 12B n=1 Tax=Colletotrichum trifolii TaxID=5466 RepID=A0A4R8RLG8_COLTR|nr:hypothetical protein CTRI78_v002696 [Colletotrichum trifolii]